MKIWMLLLLLMFVTPALAVEPDDYKLRHKQMIYSVVLVDVGLGSGSGTVIYSAQRDDEWHTYILTNEHVIAGLVTINEEWSSAAGKKIKVERRKPLEARWFQYNDYSRAIGNAGKRASIVAWDKGIDLALVRVDDTERGVGHVAALMPEGEYPHLTEKVWAVGAGLGRPPFATEGRVSLLDEIIDGEKYILMSAPIIFGNSGGALFRWSETRTRYELVGVPSRGTRVWSTVVQSMSFAIPMQTVYRFLVEECYGPIAGQKLDVHCERLGKVKKKNSKDE
jgi:S1-C subfamily serine protease